MFNVDEIAKFLEDSVEWLKKEQCGCCHYNLDDNFALYVGWEFGYDADDETIIASKPEDPVAPKTNGWKKCWAIAAGIKIRNDYDCTDFEYLNYPWLTDGSVCDYLGFTVSPTEDYSSSAKTFIGWYTELLELVENKEIVLDYPM